MDIDKLISDNIGLVYTQLHRFNRAYDDEAFSLGLEGLWKAACTYDNTKNVAFSTYASVCIYNSIAMYLRHLCTQANKPVSSLDANIDDSEITLSDIVRVEETPETTYLKKELYEVLWANVYDLHQSLPNDNAKAVISLWIESDFTAKQREIADAVGISQAYVSRTLSAFQHKLKLRMEEYLCEK